MAPAITRHLLCAMILCPSFAAYVGCSGNPNASTGNIANGGSPVGSSSSLPSGGETSSGGSGKSDSSGGTGPVATAASGGTNGTGGSSSVAGSITGGRSSVTTGGVATGGAGTGGRDTGGPTGGGSASGGVGATGGAIGSGGGSSAGGTGKGGNSSSSTGGASKGGNSSSSTGGASKGGNSSSRTGGTSKGGNSSTSTGGSSTGGTTSSGTAGTTSTGATIVPDPSWACGMPSGIPDPTRGTLVFRAALQLGATQNVGTTQYGNRRVLDVTGGTLTGDKVTGTVLTGGFDFELTLSNGVIEVEEINMLKASDGTIIYLRSCGVAPAGASEVRMVPDFEVDTQKSLAWLNTGKFVATRVVDAAGSKLEFDVYDVSSVAVGTPSVQISKPTGVPNQPWDCSTTTGAEGASVFTENVTLGSTLSVGTSDHGTRNVIPITGGTVSGTKMTGKIVSGGADYQLTPSGGSTKLDAKYVLASNDGEFVVVRNCGPMGALIPQFETRAAGAYAFLNANTFVSSNPGAGSGGVSITFYERK